MIQHSAATTPHHPGVSPAFPAPAIAGSGTSSGALGPRVDGRAGLDGAVAALPGLIALPGASYVCVVDGSGRVVDERTEGGADAAPSAAAWVEATRSGFPGQVAELHDVAVTTQNSFHLLRPVPGSADAWVYLRVRRGRGNLALARRGLAALGEQPSPALPRRAPAARAVRHPVAALPAPAGSADTTAASGRGGPCTARPTTAAARVLPHPVLRRAWTTDHAVLERLLVGLRRLV